MFALLNLLFTIYTFMLFVRVIGSWIPRFSESKVMDFLRFYTDPYLNLFKKIIPPIGMIDISPMVAFFVLQILQFIILSFFR